MWLVRENRKDVVHRVGGCKKNGGGGRKGRGVREVVSKNRELRRGSGGQEND